jgi:hypothetical protein
MAAIAPMGRSYKKVGWTMGLEPYSRIVGTIRCRPGTKIATDRDRAHGALLQDRSYKGVPTRKWGGRWDSNPTQEL